MVNALRLEGGRLVLDLWVPEGTPEDPIAWLDAAEDKPIDLATAEEESIDQTASASR